MNVTTHRGGEQVFARNVSSIRRWAEFLEMRVPVLSFPWLYLNNCVPGFQGVPHFAAGPSGLVIDEARAKIDHDDAVFFGEFFFRRIVLGVLGVLRLLHFRNFRSFFGPF